jgi:hypothetical protein
MELQEWERWFLLRHIDFGGVTSGHWWLGTNMSNVEAPTTTTSSLRLGHVLSDTVNGPPHSPPEDPDEIFDAISYVKDIRLLHAGGLLPIKAIRNKVLCYSVYSPTGWVSRVLTVHELGRCLDLSDGDLAPFADIPITQLPLDELPFLLSTPPRLLASLAAVIANELQLTRERETREPKTIVEKPATSGSPTEFPDQNEDEGFGREQAAKNDDADIAVMDWDSRALAPWHNDPAFRQRLASFESQVGKNPLTVIRGRMLARWRRNVFRSLSTFMTLTFHPKWWERPDNCDTFGEWDLSTSAARDCLTRAAGASWWDWDAGSRLFFWRWPVESRKWARDGHPMYHDPALLTRYRRRQPDESDVEVRDQVRQKLDKFRARGYVGPGTVESLTPYFTVPKGDGDVRLVFDGTRSHLNNALWAPPFVLPTINSLLRAVEVGTWMADIDIGEMFYNYSLDPAIQPYCGIDLNPYCADAKTWERWKRCVMGIKPSPHGCTKMEMLGDEMARGDPTDPANPFSYDTVRLNLPGSPTYSPTLPWVSKVLSSTGAIAADVKTYVDDKRVTGPTQNWCSLATRRAAAMLTYLGEQDACRKRVPASQRAGAWAGSVCHTNDGKVTVMVTTDKWIKARSQVARLLEISSTTNAYDFKELESIRGFLVYVVRTYPAFNPYLKGIHLTLDSWRGGRGEDGWKDPGEWSSIEEESPPATVLGVPRLQSDLQALTSLFAPTVPPRRVVRATQVLVVLYGYGDASRTGFGSSFFSFEGVRVRYGLWGRDISHQSSNFRELHNLVDAVEWELVDQFPVLGAAVEAVESLILQERIPGVELFLFTDNLVAEGAFYRGTSSNPRLFELILRLKRLELMFSLHLHVIHISGTRMMAQGTDGLSRGAAWETGTPLALVPLHLSPFERDPHLLPWLTSWLPMGAPVEVLTPLDWFGVGHGIRGGSPNTDGMWQPMPVHPCTVLVWHPPPTAAEAALEELCFGRQKRPHLRHVFVCPRLFTHAWRKRLFKFADLVFYLPPGFLPHVWERHQHEPLVIGVFLPLLSQPPWLLRGTPPVLTLQQRLRAAFASYDTDLAGILPHVWSFA